MATTSSFFGGGGGLPPVDGTIFLNAEDTLVTIDDATFIRSGFVSTDVTTYPDAFKVNSLLSSNYDEKSYLVFFGETSPTGMTFNSDGTKMYIVGSSSDSVLQYSLSTAFDLSTASPDFLSFSVFSEAISATGMTFNSDGTKMYIVGSSNDSVFQYSLSTAFDLSTASYDSVSFDVSSEETTPQDIVFNSDGTKMYIVGSSNDSVFQYSLSTAFDLSTASYDSVSFSVSSEDTSPLGMTFNDDGTKMYIVGVSSDSVFQYSLSTAFDLSTASYDSVFFDVSSEDTTPTGMTFNDDGTKMYIVGTSSDSVFQYSLSTAFDLSTASYDSVSQSTTAREDEDPEGMTFNDDGTKMYIVGRDNRSVFQYSLSTAFDLSTASYDSVSFSVSSEDTNPRDIVFNSDGTKMYIVGTSSDSVFQYSLSTAFDLSTASYDSVSFSVSSEETTPQGIVFNNDGSKMYIVGSGSDSVHQYSLSTAFDLSTAFYDSVSFSVSSEDISPTGMTFNNDGTKMYIVGSFSDSVYQYSLSTAFDLRTVSYENTSFDVSSEDTGPKGLTFNNDGTKMYIVGGFSPNVFQYSLPEVVGLEAQFKQGLAIQYVRIK